MSKPLFFYCCREVIEKINKILPSFFPASNENDHIDWLVFTVSPEKKMQKSSKSTSGIELTPPTHNCMCIVYCDTTTKAQYVKYCWLSQQSKYTMNFVLTLLSLKTPKNNLLKMKCFWLTYIMANRHSPCKADDPCHRFFNLGNNVVI